MKKYISSILILSAALELGAQNLDPTVSVSRKYEGTLLEVDKPSIKMDVPDSVYKFDLEFDYSIFNNPYKGSYKFEPYSLDLKPQDNRYAENRMYLKAGAGYNLRPVLDFAYTFRREKDFRVGVYASHQSYFGQYKTVFCEPSGVVNVLKTADGRWKGYDVSNNAGIEGRYCWTSGLLTFDLGYDGLLTKDEVVPDASWNSARGSVRVRSNTDAERYFYYDVNLDYRYAKEKNVLSFDEQDVSFKATVGPSFSRNSAILVDLETDIASYKKLGTYAGNMALAPKYVLRTGKFNLEAGVSFEYLLKPTSDFGNNVTAGQWIYPEVKVDYMILPENLDVYAVLDGGNDINPYSTLKRNNHWFNGSYGYGNALMDNTVCSYSAKGGFRGKIGTNVRYDIFGGYGKWNNAPLDMTYQNDGVLVPAIAWTAYKMAHAGIDLGMKFKKLDVDLSFLYRYTDIVKKAALGFEPAPYSGKVNAVYHWNSRIYAGISCEAASSRNCRSEIVQGTLWYGRIPWYADLGINAGFRFNNALSFWLEGGNLLNMPIQRSVCYVEKGLNFRLGICLNLD